MYRVDKTIIALYIRSNTLVFRFCTLAVLLDDQGERVQHHGQRNLRRPADHEEDLRIPHLMVSETHLPILFVFINADANVFMSHLGVSQGRCA